MELPQSITSLAYRAINGELAWRRHDVPAALAAIAASGQAVLGGEVWVALGDGHWEGHIPDRHGGPDGVWCWSTTPHDATETWQELCDQTAEESARVVAKMRVEEHRLLPCREGCGSTSPACRRTRCEEHSFVHRARSASVIRSLIGPWSADRFEA